MKQAQAARSAVGSNADSQAKVNLFAGNFQKSDEINASRDVALASTAVEHIQHSDELQLSVLQRTLQHGDTLGVWSTPRQWLVVSIQKSNGLLNADLRQRIIDCLPEHLQEFAMIGGHQSKFTHAVDTGIRQAILTLTRYLILLRMGPVSRRNTYHRSLDPSTVSQVAYTYGPQLFALGIAKRIHLMEASLEIGVPETPQPDKDENLLGSLGIDDFSGLTPHSRKCCLVECDRMYRLKEMGLWSDTPRFEHPSRSKAMKGLMRFTDQPAEKDVHRPLPDDYVGLMGQRSLWLIQDLAPNLLNIATQFVALWTATTDKGLAPSTVTDKRNAGVRLILTEYEWKDQHDQPIDKPPFILNLPKGSGVVKLSRAKNSAPEVGTKIWPPRTYFDFKSLVGAVQMAHYFVVGLSMGSRQSETMALHRECVIYAADGRPYASGRTYKLQQAHDGDLRDWLLPDIAVVAIEQQTRLVRLIEKIAQVWPSISRSPEIRPTHLWAQISTAPHSDATSPLLDLNQALVRYACTLNMDVAPGGQKIRSHRLRKTLARLVALALTQAPKILMDIFGHKSIEMTLHYILADKALRVEIEKVSRELRVMRGKEVIERMVEADFVVNASESAKLAGYGGLGAVMVSEATKTYRARVHRRGEQWGAQNVIELAELLTLQGTAWEQVRHGVICTKFSGQAGPCNRSLGRPEPSKCQTSCSHRLEEAFLREDVDSAIEAALRSYKSDYANGERLSAEFWAGQVRAHVPRFVDLREKWMKEPTVHALVSGTQD